MPHAISFFLSDKAMAAATTAAIIVLGLTCRVLVLAQAGKEKPVWRQLFGRR